MNPRPKGRVKSNKDKAQVQAQKHVKNKSPNRGPAYSDIVRNSGTRNRTKGLFGFWSILRHAKLAKGGCLAPRTCRPRTYILEGNSMSA